MGRGGGGDGPLAGRTEGGGAQEEVGDEVIRGGDRDGREGISLEMVRLWLECAEEGGHAACLSSTLTQIHRVLSGLETTEGAAPGARCCWMGWKGEDSATEWQWVRCHALLRCFCDCCICVVHF